MLTIHLVAGARPNFMKVAPLYFALERTNWCQPLIVHTGQHYDPNMSDSFFKDLGLPKPNFHLNIGSGTHAEQTAGILLAYEKILVSDPPDWVIVVGDVNSTLAATLTAKKLNLRVAHLEAGLRSKDRTMPEEINRIITDSISDLLWTPSKDADKNLNKEGISAAKISRVGNVMIDSFELLRKQIEKTLTYQEFGLTPKNFGVVTLHRPSNVDNKKVLAEIIKQLSIVAQTIPLVFALHPRTKLRLQKFGFFKDFATKKGIHLTTPMSYIKFMGLVRSSQFIVTDSGGIQEETTYLGIPCLTLRDTTERPITVEMGSNMLTKPSHISKLIQKAISGNWKQGKCPPLWDGKTAERIVEDLFRRSDKPSNLVSE